MKPSVFIFGGAAVVLIGLGAFAGRTDATAQPDREPAALAERRGYAIGYDMGARGLQGLRADGVDFDTEALIRGFADAMRDTDPTALTIDEVGLVLQDLESEVQTRLAEERIENDPVFRALAEQNRERSRAFVQEFAARPGVKATENGQLYEIIKAGDGEQAGMGDLVTVSYRGELIDGYVWAEASRAQVKVSNLMKGGGEILRRMRVGDRWRIVIPPELGFGLGGRNPDIGPNEALIAELELHAFEKPGE